LARGSLLRWTECIVVEIVEKLGQQHETEIRIELSIIMDRIMYIRAERGKSMTKRMSASDAKNRWGELVDTVVSQGESVIVENRREPMLVVISPSDFDEFQSLRKEQRLREFRERLEQIVEVQAQLNADLTEEEAEALVQRALEEDREDRSSGLQAAG
jgi:prevent-host-death family protein